MSTYFGSSINGLKTQDLQSNQNGRVHIQGSDNGTQHILNDTPHTTFSPFLNENSKSITSYTDAMTGNWLDTPLSNTFFSSENIQIIQNGIRAGVYRMSQNRFNVGNQDETNIKIIMRSIFLQHATYNTSIPISKQIETLNNLVFDYCIPNVYNEAIAYIKYKNDVSTLVTPIDRPVATDVKGNNVLELKKWF